VSGTRLAGRHRMGAGTLPWVNSSEQMRAAQCRNR